MNTRSTLVTAALFAAAAVPASGQIAGPANGGPQGAASIPDSRAFGPEYPSPDSSPRSQVPAR